MKYRSEIDGLRALAVVPVVLFHAGFSIFEGGYVGVDVFFVISGFLITSLILAEKENGTFSLLRFYERRARRILPAMFLITTVTLICASFLVLPFQLRDISLSVIAVTLFASNLHFFFESGYFDVLSEEKPLLHTWSLAVEEQFYVFFPLFLLAFWFLGHRTLAILIGLAAGFSLALAQFGGNLQLQFPFVESKFAFFSVPEWAFFLTPARAWELLVGVLIAFYLHRRPNTRPNEILATMGLGMILYAIFFFDAATPFPSIFALIPVVGTALIILFARSDSYMGQLLSLPILVGIGLISYSAYLWHQPLFAFARIGEIDNNTTLLFIALSSFCLAWLSWRFVERPFRNPNIVTRRTIFIGTGTATAASILVASLIYSSDGLAWRYASADRALVTLDVNALGDYNNGLFNSYRLRDFPEGDGRKVLIVGDSFAKDFLNVLNDAKLNWNARLSTHTIEAGCGNLFLTTNTNDHISPSIAHVCRHQVRFNSTRVQDLIRRADTIFLASAWHEWEVNLISESLQSLGELTSASIIVVGPKDFGEVRIRELVGLSVEERRHRTNVPNESVRRMNTLLRETVPKHQYIDLISEICGDGLKCPIFTPEDQLISWDGAHLTPEGARWLSTILKNNKLFAN